jgi:hypothetical protein
VLAALEVSPASRPKIDAAKVALMWRLRRGCGAVWRLVAQKKYNFYWESRADFSPLAHQTDPSGADAQAKYRKPLFLSDGGVFVCVGERGLGRAF